MYTLHYYLTYSTLTIPVYLYSYLYTSLYIVSTLIGLSACLASNLLSFRTFKFYQLSSITPITHK